MDGEILGLKELGTLQIAVKDSQAICADLYHSALMIEANQSLHIRTTPYKTVYFSYYKLHKKFMLGVVRGPREKLITIPLQDGQVSSCLQSICA